MLNQKMDHRLDELAEKITKRDTINRELYAKYDVKHGLRDADGTLIGYYEKHEFRSPETIERYAF